MEAVIPYLFKGRAVYISCQLKLVHQLVDYYNIQRVDLVDGIHRLLPIDSIERSQSCSMFDGAAFLLLSLFGLRINLRPIGQQALVAIQKYGCFLI